MVRAYREELRSVTDRYHELAELLKDVKVPELQNLRQNFEDMNRRLEALNDEFTSLLMKKDRTKKS